jgi:hypothetical protein
MAHPIVVTLVENGVTEITVPGERTLVTQVGGDLTEVFQPGEPVVVTLLSQGFEGDIAAYADAAAASAAAALQSELNAANTDLVEAVEAATADVLTQVFQNLRASITNASTAGTEQEGTLVVTGSVQEVASASDQYLGELSILAIVLQPDGRWVMTPGASELVRKLFMTQAGLEFKYVPEEGDRRVVQQPTGLVAI